MDCVDKFLSAPVPDLSAAVSPPSEEVLSFGAPDAGSLGGLHMLVAITQDTINFQLKQLFANEGDFPDFPRSLSLELGDDSLKAQLAAPLIRLVVPGAKPTDRVALFTVRMKEGTLTRSEIVKNPATGKREIVDRTIEIKDWAFTFKVNLDMVQLRAAAETRGRPIPAVVRKYLEFDEQQFEIRQLFMNFQDANLLEYDAALTSLKMPDGSALELAIVQRFVELFALHVKALRDQRPYVLGYTVSHRARPDRPTPLFAPSACTFSVYGEPGDPGMSCLQFLLMTGKGSELPGGDVGVFGHNWMKQQVAAEVGSSGRMIISTEEFNRQFFVGTILGGIRNALKRVQDDELGLEDETFAWYEKGALIAEMRDWVGKKYGERERDHYFGGNVAAKPSEFFPGLSVWEKGWGLYRYRSTLDLCGGSGRIVTEDWHNFGVKDYAEETKLISCFVYATSGVPIKIHGGGMIWQRMDIYRHPLKTSVHKGGYWIKHPFEFTIVLAAGVDGKVNVSVCFDDSKTCTSGNVKGEWWTRDRMDIVDHEKGKAAALIAKLKQRLSETLPHAFNALESCVVFPAGSVFSFKQPALDSAGRLYLDITYKDSAP